MLRDVAHQEKEAGACPGERGRGLAGDLESRRADDGQRAELRGEGKERPGVEAATVDHHRVRELVGGAGEQRQRERELAARPAAGEQRQAATRQAADPGEAIDRRAARPWLGGRHLRRPRQRLAAETDPNRVDRGIESKFLHRSLAASWGEETQEGSGGGTSDYIERMFGRSRP